jgi:hypothetical protein
MKVITGALCGFYGIVTWHVLRDIRKYKEIEGHKININITNSLYNDILRGPNMWEYYYKQIDPIEGNYQLLYEKDMPQVLDLYNGCDIKQTLHILYRNYIKYNDITQKIINKQLSFFDTYKNVLGVHVRKTDKEIDTPGKRNINDTEVRPIIDKLLIENNYDKIYLATDDIETYNFFIKTYGDLIIRTNRIRSAGNKSVHHHMPEQPGYIKGLDAILDMEALSRCSFLVRMISNLSATSLIINPALESYNMNIIIGNDLKDTKTGLSWEEYCFNIYAKPYIK